MKIIFNKSVLKSFCPIALSFTLYACNETNSVGASNTSSITHNSKSASTLSESVTTTEFAYIVDTNDSRIYMYSASGGVLTPLSPSFIAGSNPTHITISPNKMFAYVPNNGSNGISTYSIDPQTGQLSLIDTAVTSVSNPIKLTMTSNNKFAYATSCSAPANTQCTSTPRVDVYKVESQGILTRTEHIQFPTESSISNGIVTETVRPSVNIAIDSTNQYLYVGSNINDNSVHPMYIYKIDPNSGKLIKKSNIAQVLGMTMSMQMSYGNLYVASYTGITNGPGSDLSTFMETQQDGELAPTYGYKVGSSNNSSYPKPLIVTHNGNYVYVADGEGDMLYMYGVNQKLTDGTLVSLSPATAYAHTPQALAIDSTDQYLYMVSKNAKDPASTYSSYKIESTGVLTSVTSQSPIDNKQQVYANDIAIVDFSLAKPILIEPPLRRRINIPTEETFVYKMPTNVDPATIQVSVQEYIGESLNGEQLSMAVDNASIPATCLNNPACWGAAIILTYTYTQYKLTTEADKYLLPHKTYRLQVNAKDYQGIQMRAQNLVHTTQNVKGVMTEPAPQATDVLLNTRFKFAFPSYIDKNKFKSSQIHITDSTGKSYLVGNNYAIQNLPETNVGVLIFKPEQTLKSDSTVRIVIESVSSMEGVGNGGNMSAFGTINTINLLGHPLIFLDTNGGIGYPGNLGGTDGADASCNNSPDRPADNDLPNGLRRVYKFLGATDPDRDDEIFNPRHLCGPEIEDDDGNVTPGECGGVNLVNWTIYSNTPYFKRIGAEDQLITVSQPDLERFNNNFEIPIVDELPMFDGLFLEAITGITNEFRSSGLDCHGFISNNEDDGSTVGNPATIVLEQIFFNRQAHCNALVSKMCITVGVQ